MTGWCWHRWTKWIDGYVTTESIFYEGERESFAQARRCEKCGKLRIRSPR